MGYINSGHSHLDRKALDHRVYEVLSKEKKPVQAQVIIDTLSGRDSGRLVQPYEVARSIWRLVDSGKAKVRAGKGVSLATLANE